MSTCSCIYCRKEYSIFGIDTHFLRTHGSDNEKEIFSQAAVSNKNKSARAKVLYESKPKKCSFCGESLPYDKRRSTFCSHTCSAKYNNQKRSEAGFVMSANARKQISEKLSLVVGPYTKIRFSPCKFCKNIHLFTSRHRVCSSCQHLKWNNKKKTKSSISYEELVRRVDEFDNLRPLGDGHT